MRIFRLFLIYMIPALAGALFFVKYKMQELNALSMHLDAEIMQEEDNIHIMQAEFAHLAKPQNIERLAAIHLKMSPITADQLINIQLDKDYKAKVFERGKLKNALE